MAAACRGRPPLPCRASPPQVGRLAGRDGFTNKYPSHESKLKAIWHGNQNGCCLAGSKLLANLPPCGEMPGRAEGGIMLQRLRFPRRIDHPADLP
ncbi:hypothetical protein GFL58_22955 [Rhizobium leguminosarum bv. viciae]|nr:hypothetical protein [Rhizobium leguminosarum bv. viciae]